jgi:hypothetical protein
MQTHGTQHGLEASQQHIAGARAESRAGSRSARSRSFSAAHRSGMCRRDAFTSDMQDYPAGAGSGIVWDKQGHVVTNYHVIKGASTVQVVVDGGQEYAAKVLGQDEDRDVAVLQVEEKPVRHACSTPESALHALRLSACSSQCIAWTSLHLCWGQSNAAWLSCCQQPLVQPCKSRLRSSRPRVLAMHADGACCRRSKAIHAGGAFCPCSKVMHAGGECRRCRKVMRHLPQRGGIK